MAKKVPSVDFSDSYISIILGFLVVLVGGILLYNFFTKTKPTVPAKNITLNAQVSATSSPKISPSVTPTKIPTKISTPTLTGKPTRVPTRSPSLTLIPTRVPTKIPTRVPSKAPTPTLKPLPTLIPTATPTQKGTASLKLPSKYRVAANDTLWSIAEKFYSSGYNWVDIAKENKIDNPNLLAVGKELTIPNTKVIVPGTIKGELLPTAVSTSKTYTVKRGDTLWGIAVQVYADGFAWPKIAQANRLANPQLIHAGNRFVIP
ncbi:hypothetical protein A3D77_04300 [Candidatus Gottesmanbacteria bacterium RIFCSPHIGHO2_02_FULL_39_11]|uniref:LysM domain-containing protein n=1 Tax=Candidatus Gottesmanbacteria bacterium RIFCSPHIGHO2_02_FULL_39_11 TaxID=1798382 RepID=A0A1F5ZJ75_9BACT|nr:MAG: hypothetical protein A3D77_04300 [Candidatus Gottesmanbacteria bacterium RIFCSPHIGHO2_02_FULL_39_11]